MQIIPTAGKASRIPPGHPTSLWAPQLGQFAWARTSLSAPLSDYKRVVVWVLFWTSCNILLAPSFTDKLNFWDNLRKVTILPFCENNPLMAVCTLLSLKLVCVYWFIKTSQQTVCSVRIEHFLLLGKNCGSLWNRPGRYMGVRPVEAGAAPQTPWRAWFCQALCLSSPGLFLKHISPSILQKRWFQTLHFLASEDTDQFCSH